MCRPHPADDRHEPRVRSPIRLLAVRATRFRRTLGVSRRAHRNLARRGRRPDPRRLRARGSRAEPRRRQPASPVASRRASSCTRGQGPRLHADPPRRRSSGSTASRDAHCVLHVRGDVGRGTVSPTTGSTGSRRGTRSGSIRGLLLRPCRTRGSPRSCSGRAIRPASTTASARNQGRVVRTYLDLPRRTGPVFELVVGGRRRGPIASGEHGWNARSARHRRRSLGVSRLHPTVGGRVQRRKARHMSPAEAGGSASAAPAYLRGAPRRHPGDRFSTWLPSVEGVVSFSTPRRPSRPSETCAGDAASMSTRPRVAEEYFDSPTVLDEPRRPRSLLGNGAVRAPAVTA